jgi:probable phosphoglycerate mutase
VPETDPSSAANADVEPARSPTDGSSTGTPSDSADARPDDAAPAPTDEAPPITRILLVRHAVTRETGPVLSGRKPGIDLSDEGRAQAVALGERLRALPIDAIYASPIERTVQTAQAVAAHHELTVEVLPGVVEAEYGEWTGQPIKELAKTDLWKQVQRAPSLARFPAGESILEMQSRAVAAIQDVATRHVGQLVVVVSHADVIKAAVAHFAGMHLDQFQRLVISPASVTGLLLGPLGAAIVKWNDTGAFDELVPKPADAAATTDGEGEGDGTRPTDADATGASGPSGGSGGAAADGGRTAVSVPGGGGEPRSDA